MAYLELFERVFDFVRGTVVNVRFVRGPSLSFSAIEEKRAKAILPIPKEMVEFYAEVGDGLQLRWETPGGPFAAHDFLPLSEAFVADLAQVKHWVPWWGNDYDFRHTDDPALAKATAARMRNWVPFHPEGNGDQFCLDSGTSPAAVVFDQHDWFDGGTGKNGHVMADSLLDFYTEWSKVCFQCPSGLWWPSVFNKSSSGVKWSSHEFSDLFRLE